MRQEQRRLFARLCRLCLTGAMLLLTFVGAAHADVVGRLHFSVKNAADEKPLTGARIVLKDSANVRPDVVLTTDANGGATTPPLENHAWGITTSAEGFQNDVRDVTVVADTTTEVEVLLEPLKEKVITITTTRNLVQPSSTGSIIRRNRDFTLTYPVTAGNPQSLTKAIRANPGFVEDSVNQVHPRGEHGSTSIYINGFLLPGALQGRAGQFLTPDALQSIDVQTGGYAPEYGGEMAAVLNLTLRAGTMDPFITADLGGGGFGTFQGILTAGGQGGSPYSVANANGVRPRRFGYLINLSQRNTNNAIEPPQPDNQTAHNGQTSTTVFTNFDYRLNDRDNLSLIFNTAPARTEVANRTGLPGKYAPFGQGFGYGGALTAEEASAAGILSQQAARQDIYQVDQNTFATLQYRTQFSATTTGLFSLGYSRSRLDIRNNNPNNSAIIDPATLPDDSSIEFSPNIKRDYRQLQFQGNVTLALGQHTYKFGALYADQHGDESYLLVPGSQIALTNLYLTDPRLAPQGGTVGGTEDSPTYTLNDPTVTPTLRVKREGYYAAAYAQDTFRVTPAFTVNYGLRLDAYHATQDLGQSTVNTNALSPRVNLAYSVTPLTIVRTSYNRIFTTPPLAQGAVIGESIKPAQGDLYEISAERQFGRFGVAKLAYYNKEYKNFLDTGILLEGTQIGAYTTLNLEKETIKGTELSYQIDPLNGVGLGGYLAWANVVAKARGRDSSDPNGESSPATYNDHDALNTVTAGVAYTLPVGASAGLNVYYTTGVESSRLIPLDEGEAGSRQARTEVNLRVSSGRKLLRGVEATLGVENLFASRKVINFNSAFSGTRFQQGRRVLLSVNGRF